MKLVLLVLMLLQCGCSAPNSNSGDSADNADNTQVDSQIDTDETIVDTGDTIIDSSTFTMELGKSYSMPGITAQLTLVEMSTKRELCLKNTTTNPGSEEPGCDLTLEGSY